MGLNGILPNAAAGAYSASQNIGGPGGHTVHNVSRTGTDDSDGKTDGSGGVSFSDFLSNNIQRSIDTMKSGEQMSAKAVAGKADITDVVQAVTAAELTLQTVVSVRDRMISAYQDIMRMPI